MDSKFMAVFVQAKRIIQLAWPIVITQLALSGMVTIDTIMAARYSSVDMAAVGTSLGLWYPISLFALGVLAGLGPIFSRDYGARNKRTGNSHFSNALVITTGLVAFTALLMLFKTPLLAPLAFDPAMLTIMHDYLFYLTLGLPGFCFFILYRVLNESMGNTRLLMWLQLAALALNIPLNWMFIFGEFGAPELGGAGAGISTTLLNYLLFFVIWYISNKHANCRPYIKRASIKFVTVKKLQELLKLGLPVGVTMFLEVALFGAVALAIGRYGPEAAAAHQVAINFASMMWMIPLSLSIATSVVIGQSMGAKSPLQAIQATKAGVYIAVCFAAVTATITIVGRHYVSLIYTQDVAVVEIATALLIWAAIFQLSDATQCVTLGSLRGFKDTQKPMWFTIFSYWVIGFPAGWIFAETTWFWHEPLGLHGYWIGLLTSLSCAAILLSLRLKRIIYKIRRISRFRHSPRVR
ncbi:MATE family efflux transporter [Saccharobesus litoralis]|uniref:Multidrug-efflux transporter n=1 Tax=Saccharobesus litoralis TaxID=2172099 RepID=A0A2S0VM00_9ALTE|nr:MATE family efflux transporter [Saccharobesus litoralis]AWB65219.1 MATE family efflux transporter [Saccharobesus litoralis]